MLKFTFRGGTQLSLREFDNCPVCGRPCDLEIDYDYSEDSLKLDSDLGLEMAFATCKTCKTKWRRKEDWRTPGLQVYEKWAVRPSNGNIGRWVKIKERRIPVGEL